MSMAKPLGQELEHEAAVTRKCLERVPTDKFGWKPHPKSMSLGQLASHITEIAGWAADTLEKDGLNFNMSEYKPYAAKDSAALLKQFDEQIGKAKTALGKASDDRLMAKWKLTMDGNEMINMPRVAVMRSFVLSHMIHHRGQLSVYLRENNIPVPAIYGPSADEKA